MRFGRTRYSIASLAAVAAVAAGLVASGSAFGGPIDENEITAPTLSPRNDCNLPTSTQTLLSYGDQDSYFLAPGGSFEGNSAAGWYLAGGARVTTVMHRGWDPDGVLEIPSGGQAVSPVVCVTVDCPHARIFVRDLTGGSADVDFGVSYYRDGTWSRWKTTGVARGTWGWDLSDRLDIQPERTNGFQQVRFAFYGTGYNKTFQLDDFWVDPRASR